MICRVSLKLEFFFSSSCIQASQVLINETAALLQWELHLFMEGHKTSSRLSTMLIFEFMVLSYVIFSFFRLLLLVDHKDIEVCEMVTNFKIL